MDLVVFWGFLSSYGNYRVWVDDYRDLHGLQLHPAVMFPSPSFHPTSRIVILVSPPPFRTALHLFILLVIPLSSPLAVVSFKHLCPFLRGGAPDSLNLLHSFITSGEHFNYIPLLSRFRPGGSTVHLLTPQRIVSYVISKTIKIFLWSRLQIVTRLFFNPKSRIHFGDLCSC